ncbi:MAG: ribonuclease III, partial [Myxococcota bacterium]
DVTLDEAARELCEGLGYDFESPALLRDALTHSSFRNERPDLAPEDNERLEFLGDAVVGMVVASLLVEHFPSADEGELTQRRADLVSEKGLAKVAVGLGLGPAMRLGRGEEKSGGREKPRLLSSALEACFGAIYLDAGVQVAFEVTRSVFESWLHTSAPGHRDFKSRAQEWAQGRLGMTPKYRVVSSDGPDHARQFIVALGLDGEQVARGEGRSKIEAEQAAAREALSIWSGDEA